MADISTLAPIPPDDRDKAAAWFEALQAGARQEMAVTVRDGGSVAKAMARLGTWLDDSTRALYARFDHLRKKKKSIPVVACKMGCVYCCTNRVTCQIPEVIRIAEFIQAKWSPEQIEAARARIEAHVSTTASLEGEAKYSRVQPCAFLTEAGACGIHNVRPISCRGFSSFDVRQCRASYDNPTDHDINIPIVAPQFRASRAILKGVGEGLVQLGIESEAVELVQGVKICLDNPDAVSGWLAGGKDFEPAIDREANARVPKG
jgi:Fe-S-cluster containining protein